MGEERSVGELGDHTSRTNDASRKRFLIINADDLGYTRGINRTIAQCHLQGVLTSATLMANGDAFQDALATLRDLPGLGVGVHLALTELKPVALPHTIPGLTGGTGSLPATPGVLFRALLEGTIPREEMQTELECQIRKVLDEGVAPTHLDTHKHVHLLPEVLDCVIQVAQKYNIRWIRNPFDETSVLRSVSDYSGKDRLALLRQFFKVKVFSVFRSGFGRRLGMAGLHSPDHFFGTAITGIWKPSSLSRLVRQLPAGVNELMTHPGMCDAELRRQRTRLQDSREQERDILLAPSLKRLLQAQQIILTHYGEHVR